MDEWEDRYYPADFYSRAAGLAKSYCKRYPDADRETVYYAASEAAEQYERSAELRTHKFKNIVYLRIVHALHERRKKEDIMGKAPDPNRDAMIADYNSGMSYAEIAERYHKSYGNVNNQFLVWNKKGLVVLRGHKKEPALAEPTQTAADDTAHAYFDKEGQVYVTREKEPASAEPTQAKKDDLAKTSTIVPPLDPIVNTTLPPPSALPQEDMSSWLSEMIDMAHNHSDGVYDSMFDSGYRFTYANAAAGSATLEFAVRNTKFRLKLEVVS